MKAGSLRTKLVRSVWIRVSDLARADILQQV
jgi:hypothetical protein